MERNNKPIIFALIIVCLITLFFCFAHTYYEKTHYSTVAVVDSIKDNEVLMVDPLGDIWAVDHVDNVKVGDLVEIYFHNNNTTYTHYDDIIVNVKRCGE